MDDSPARIRPKRAHNQNPALEKKRQELTAVLKAIARVKAKTVYPNRFPQTITQKTNQNRVTRKSRLVITPSIGDEISSNPLQSELPSITAVYPIILIMAALLVGMAFAVIHPALGLLMIPFVFGLGWDSKMFSTLFHFVFQIALLLILAAISLPALQQSRFYGELQTRLLIVTAALAPYVAATLAAFYLGRFVANIVRRNNRIYTREEVLKSRRSDSTRTR